jgi:protein ImuB
MDLPDGIIIDATGCSHSGGDHQYIHDILKKIYNRDYTVSIAMADTAGAAWGLARYQVQPCIIEKDAHINAILDLPPEALRIDIETQEKLHKLGLHQIRDFIAIPRVSLRRRFGESLIKRMNQAIGAEDEIFETVHPVQLYEERLPCLEPILTRAGVEIGSQIVGRICGGLHEARRFTLCLFSRHSKQMEKFLN